jgi:hypothetical protein
MALAHQLLLQFPQVEFEIRFPGFWCPGKFLGQISKRLWFSRWNFGSMEVKLTNTCSKIRRRRVRGSESGSEMSE